MREWIVFLLPPAMALAGMRLLRLLLGAEVETRFGHGVRFALGLGVGMLAFTQLFLLGALLGLNLSALIAWTALGWGLVESVLRLPPNLRKIRQFKWQKGHWWLLLLLPLVWHFVVFSQLSVLEGTMEFDAAVHWLIKSKILYLKQGAELLQQMHNPNLAYVHWDYPLLVPALYALNFGLMGSVDEFVSKVWPCWMVFALCLAILSLGNVWQRPNPLPIIVATIFCLLPATLQFIHWEGGTIPLTFYVSLSALLILQALTRSDLSALAAALLMLAGGAMTKFEGILYTAFWLLVLVPVGWQRQWLGHPLLRKISLFALICWLPYVTFRLNHPVAHLESGWPRVAAQDPGSVWSRYPTIFAVGLERCFFHPEFAHWTVLPDGRLQWDGKWQGGKTLTHYQLSLLPWLTVSLLGISLWNKRHWRSLLALTAVVLAVFAFLTFVLACLPGLLPATPEGSYILSKTGDDLTRYSYPLFVAWFLGIVSTWFFEHSIPLAEAATGSHKSGKRRSARGVRP